MHSPTRNPQKPETAERTYGWRDPCGGDYTFSREFDTLLVTFSKYEATVYKVLQAFRRLAT
ncbi:hypothetical protein NITGR_90015 [Nitrospina gracilis 3/211]|uniref:Uncharacterized protein n=1 Tax=Nitrospina gracilis (strain 3/211) TaxID=1266370 RepID=M1Z2B3_NITG3|nr:hypothetical protein NITGR_90015 [Nitrospina gracilis 3/211]